MEQRIAPQLFLLSVLAGFLVLTPLAPAAAQSPEDVRRQAEQQLGRPVSDQEILERLRQSGLSPEEVRRRLEEQGAPRTAADPYLSVMDGRSARVPADTNPIPLLRVLAGREAEPRGEGRADEWSSRRDESFDDAPPVFGRDLFRRAGTQFLPLTTGPVPSDYRVGPGDELILVITGGVELAYELTVTREGWVVIPDVGRVFVNDRSLDGLRDVFLQRLSQVYSGIGRGGDAATQFYVSVGRLRTNQVFVIGEVERPAAYEVSSLANALTALYQAGGPRRSGSFRNIRVNRGGRTIRTIDLYDYLLRGLTATDLRLEHGDVVFVPAVEHRVEVSGPVVRPGIYELQPGDDLRDLLRFAGGVRAEAELRRVQIDRVLDPDRRTPGQDRALLDVPVGSLAADAGERIPVKGGDRVTIFAVLEDVRNDVAVSGAVWRPGNYAAADGARLWDVLERAGGLLPDMVEGRAQIQRLQEDHTRRLIPVSLGRDASGDPLENPVLEGQDQVIVFAARNLREERAVSVGGWVREPGVYPYVEGMSVADLILQAGGLRTGAYLSEAEVSRVVMEQERSQALTRNIKVPLDSALVFDRGGRGGRGNPVGVSDTEAAKFSLQNLDALYIRKAPGFDLQSRVLVTGEVLYPGPYSIERRTERLSDVIERAGGITDEAYLEGFQLWRVRRDSGERERAARENELRGEEEERGSRDREREAGADTVRVGGVPYGPLDSTRLGIEFGEVEEDREPEGRVERTRVGIDFAEIARNPSSRANIALEANDSIYIPTYIPTVTVEGAVAAPVQVLHSPGQSVEYYVRQAGGYNENADKGRVRVQLANGAIDVKGRRFLFLGGGVTDPDPGSVVTVPARPPRDGTGMSTREVVGIVTGIATAAASLIIAVSR
jgi:polysaccharide biosynthesis/export protein